MVENIKNALYWNENADIEQRTEDLLSRLTLDEKISLSAGFDNWHIAPINRLGLKPFAMTDGPHGVRFKSSGDHIATYFPTSIGLAATWNPDLAAKFGEALGKETRAVGYQMILGPAINIARTPLNGRTFEYQSEDPYLISQMVVPIVQQIQKQRVSACVKHYACNNQETRRFSYNAIVSQRALEEIYLPGFKAAVEKANAMSVMACYNRINGDWGCENKALVNDTLMEKWGFKGFVVSDWGATKPIENIPKLIRAGLSLEMGHPIRYAPEVLKSTLEAHPELMEKFNDNIRRIIRTMIFTGMFDSPEKLPAGAINTPEHFQLARQIAAEGIVLVKNENNVLPIPKNIVKRIAVLGENADRPMGNGGGSSAVTSQYEITPLQGIKEKCASNGSKIEIISDPYTADAVIFVTGLNHDHHMDGEGRDRKKFEMPKKAIKGLKRLFGRVSNLIVVLINGSPVEMNSWVNEVPAVVEACYPGMEGGRALADILFGDVNPSGKMPLTFPIRLQDSPAHKSKKTYPGKDEVLYEEDIMVGYRHFDTNNITPQICFGHGLSYTTFKYENIAISPPEISLKEQITVECDVINTGKLSGSEVVQLYIEDEVSSVPRPKKELKRFQKITLNPQEKSHVKFILNEKDLQFYHPTQNKWVSESGKFNIHVGSSSRDIRLTKGFSLKI